MLTNFVKSELLKRTENFKKVHKHEQITCLQRAKGPDEAGGVPFFVYAPGGQFSTAVFANSYINKENTSLRKRFHLL